MCFVACLYQIVSLAMHFQSHAHRESEEEKKRVLRFKKVGGAYFTIKLQIISSVSRLDKQASVSKKSNSRRHYKTHKLVGTRREEKLWELKSQLKKATKYYHAVINIWESAVCLN
jgi:hypothetical protein